MLTAGLTAGVLAGPLTPADVSTGQAQAFSDWGTRSVFFVIVGLFFAHVVGRTRRSAHLELEGLRLGSELAGAADRGELVLEYQPVVALRQREVIAAEALVRWEHPDRGRVMPEQFIPQSESSGEIHPLGAWVIDEACRQFAQWRKGALDADRPFRLSVNVSIHQVEDGDLAAVVERALRRHRIPANGLVLELTETAILTEHSDALRQLDRLRAMGVLIAVDDFGTGYSSLAYLRRLPVDIVKIDRAFVQRLGRDAHADDRRIAAGIIDLAHDLGLTVVAEGIETESQARMLLDLGCHRGQGFLFAAPLAPDELMALIADERAGRDPTPTGARSRPNVQKALQRWFGGSLRIKDTTGQHEARTVALAALFIAGACMALTTSALTPERTLDTVTAALVGSIGIPVAILLLRFGSWIPRWGLHVLLAGGTLVVSMGALLSDDPGLMVATTSLYIWVVLYAAAFYDWRVTIGHFALVAGCLTGVLTVTDTYQPVGILILILGSS
ncbi:MAG TPA: EAL domain-containing protein, partial [Acidimicrobiales bacterium]